MWAMVRSSSPADPVDALARLFGRFAQFAVGGFLLGVIIPLSTPPLSVIHPGGANPVAYSTTTVRSSWFC